MHRGWVVTQVTGVPCKHWTSRVEGGRVSKDRDGGRPSFTLRLSGWLTSPPVGVGLAEGPHSADVYFSLHSIVPDIAVGTKVGVSSLALHPTPTVVRDKDLLTAETCLSPGSAKTVG